MTSLDSSQDGPSHLVNQATTQAANRGRFIVLEGIEGVGKTTQARQLFERLSQVLPKPPFLTREPGGTPLAEQVRQIVLHQSSDEYLCAEAELLLMMASRLQHWRQVIQPKLEQGEWVICDRFIGSSLAYQGAGRGLSQTMIQDLHTALDPTMVPDQVILLDLTVAESRDRLKNRALSQDRMEANNDDFFHKARQAFLTAAQAHNNYAVIQANQKPAAVAQNIWTIVQSMVELSQSNGELN